jgi:hypothetical protein
MPPHAILIGNSVSYGITAKNIPATVVNSIVKDFATKLDNLDEYSFDVTAIINKPVQEASQQVKEAIKKASASSELLFIYYFGHAVRSLDSENSLYLFFKDSDWLDLPSMLDFADVIKWLRAYRLEKVVIALDCCYAGGIRSNLNLLDQYGGQYYFMASVTSRDQAGVDYGDDQPIGIFTRHLLSGFSDSGARAPLGTNVTFESLYEFASERTKNQSSQSPISAHNGIARETFFEQKTDLSIAPGIRNSVPKKSTYHKIYTLISFLSLKPFKDISTLYNFVATKEPTQFKTPIKVKENVIEYRFMSEESFSWYVELCRNLGIIKPGLPLQLTDGGKSMARKRGANFNQGLFDAVKSTWAKFGIEITFIEQSIGNRMRNNGVPTTDAIYLELYVNKKMRMSKDYFRVMLDLTAYIGALGYSREHTYFLSNFSKTLSINSD